MNQKLYLLLLIHSVMTVSCCIVIFKEIEEDRVADLCWIEDVDKHNGKDTYICNI